MRVKCSEGLPEAEFIIKKAVSTEHVCSNTGCLALCISLGGACHKELRVLEADSVVSARDLQNACSWLDSVKTETKRWLVVTGYATCCCFFYLLFSLLLKKLSRKLDMFSLHRCNSSISILGETRENWLFRTSFSNQGTGGELPMQWFTKYPSREHSSHNICKELSNSITTAEKQMFSKIWTGFTCRSPVAPYPLI